MRVTPPIGIEKKMSTSGIPPAKVLHSEEGWELLDATTGRFNTGVRGWQSVIKHYCSNINGSPYWMLLEWHNTPTMCAYCKKDMPAGIVALFKLQNMETIR